MPARMIPGRMIPGRMMPGRMMPGRMMPERRSGRAARRPPLRPSAAAVALARRGLLASEALFVHRNTFNYRLNAFIRESGLDIRDYHNALLLEIYFQLSPRFS